MNKFLVRVQLGVEQLKQFFHRCAHCASVEHPIACVMPWFALQPPCPGWGTTSMWQEEFSSSNHRAAFLQQGRQLTFFMHQGCQIGTLLTKVAHQAHPRKHSPSYNIMFWYIPCGLPAQGAAFGSAPHVCFPLRAHHRRHIHRRRAAVRGAAAVRAGARGRGRAARCHSSLGYPIVFKNFFTLRGCVVLQCTSRAAAVIIGSFGMPSASCGTWRLLSRRGMA